MAITLIGWRNLAASNTATSRQTLSNRLRTVKWNQHREQRTLLLKNTYGDFSPKLVDLTDNVLFGDVWERPELSKRDRSLVTVTALICRRTAEQLPFHLKRARENGVTESELIETITDLAFYGG